MSKNEAVMDATDVTYNLNMLVQDGDEITFVTPDRKKYRAHNIIRPHGKKAMVVSLIAEPEPEKPKHDYEYLECRNCGYGVDACKCGDMHDFFDTRNSEE